MAVEPEVILLDEPTSSLDPELVTGILDIASQVGERTQKRTMLIVTHEMRFAQGGCRQGGIVYG